MSEPRAWHVTLPDGTDTTSPSLQTRVEERVRAHYGPLAVVMWPRHRDVLDGADLVIPVVPTRPAAQTIRLGDGVRPTDAGRVAVTGERQGLGSLVALDTDRRTATFARVDAVTNAVRDRIATLLKAHPWEVEVATHQVVDERSGERRLDQVVVTRTPTIGVSADKRSATWRELLMTLPGGSTGWEVLDDPVTGIVRLRYGQPRRLPDLAVMPDLLPDRLMPQDWARIPLGVTPEGGVATVDLGAGPHGLVVGPTGTGKTVLLLQWAVSALTRGHRLVIIDPTKAGLDFLAVRPWCSAWADTLEAGQATIEHVYGEVERRKRILQQFEAVKWSELHAEVRRQHDVHPTTVIVDEVGSLLIEEAVPKSLPRDSEFRLEAEARNVARAVIGGTIGRIAREARFAGIHLVLALQRPDAAIISGELRSNLTSAVQLAAPGKPLSLDALRMVMPGEVAGQAAEVLVELDDGRSRGLAVTAAEGGSAAGFRVAFGAPAEIPVLLDGLDVSRPEPWRIEARGPSMTSTGPEPDGVPVGRGAATEPVPTETVAISLADLDALVEEGDEDEFAAPAAPRPPGGVDLSDLW